MVFQWLCPKSIKTLSKSIKRCRKSIETLSKSIENKVLGLPGRSKIQVVQNRYILNTASPRNHCFLYFSFSFYTFFILLYTFTKENHKKV